MKIPVNTLLTENFAVEQYFPKFGIKANYFACFNFNFNFQKKKNAGNWIIRNKLGPNIYCQTGLAQNPYKIQLNLCVFTIIFLYTLEPQNLFGFKPNFANLVDSISRRTRLFAHGTSANALNTPSTRNQLSRRRPHRLTRLKTSKATCKDVEGFRPMKFTNKMSN